MRESGKVITLSKLLWYVPLFCFLRCALSMQRKVVLPENEFTSSKHEHIADFRVRPSVHFYYIFTVIASYYGVCFECTSDAILLFCHHLKG